MNIACRVEFFYTAAACVAAVLYAAVSIFDFLFLPVPTGGKPPLPRRAAGFRMRVCALGAAGQAHRR